MTINPSDASRLSIIATCVVAYKDTKTANKYLEDFKDDEVKLIALATIKGAEVYKPRCPHCDQILK